MIEPPKLWRNAWIAACDAWMARFAAGALLSRGPRIAWAGAERNLPPDCCPDQSHDDGGFNPRHSVVREGRRVSGAA
jgi:hypothetical protein